MARTHFAFRFDPEAAAEPIRLLVNRPAMSLSSGLLDQARAALRRPSPAFEDALTALRFDEGWVGDDVDEADRAAKCFVLVLMSGSVAVPSLGRSGEEAFHVVLETLLPDAGWSAAEVSSLLRGDPLDSYLGSVGLDALAPSLSGLDDLIGWLSPQRATALAIRLADVERNFVTGNDRRGDLLARIVPAWGAQADELALKAYARARSLLSEAARPRRALLLALD